MIWVKVDILVQPCQLMGYHKGGHSFIVMMTDKQNFESSNKNMTLIRSSVATMNLKFVTTNKTNNFR